MSTATRPTASPRSPGTARAIPSAAPREQWSSRTPFVLAAAGSAVGLGNVWTFPYLAGRYGGGAFVLVYLACLLLVGLPILVAELTLGRRGARNPVDGLHDVARAAERSALWRLPGWLGVAAGLLLLAFYGVVGGWSLAYAGLALRGAFASAADPSRVTGLFAALLASPGIMLACHTAVVALTVAIVARGVRAGLEPAARWLMPALLALLLVLVAHAAIASGQLTATLRLLLRPDFALLGVDGLLAALAHAFVTLGVGMGGLLAYGSYLPRDVSIPRAGVTIAAIDTAVALLAGLAIFPVVLAHGLEAAEGPGLVFVSLPVSFARLPGGSALGALFFAFLLLAALTSAIALLEPAVSVLCERTALGRRTAALLAGGAAWLLGVPAVLSFNRWSQVQLLGRGPFDLLDVVTSGFLLPIGTLLLTLMAGWALPRDVARDALPLGNGVPERGWRFALRWVAPAGVLVVLAHALLG